MRWPTDHGDVRLKCACCRKWMRRSPTVKTPAKRRSPPSASICTACKPTEIDARRDWRRDFVHCERRGCNVIEALADLVR